MTTRTDQTEHRAGNDDAPDPGDTTASTVVLHVRGMQFATEKAVDEAPLTAQDVMGHGGGARTSMEDMVANRCNRFLVATLFSVPILLWSGIGREVLGFEVAAPFGLRDDIFAFLLSLPMVFWSAWIFFDGAPRALRAHTLDMMVLAAIAVGTGWVYSVGVTVTGGDLALSMAVVPRDGEAVEVPTAEVVAGDLLLVRPGAKTPPTAPSRKARATWTRRWSPVIASRSTRRPGWRRWRRRHGDTVIPATRRRPWTN